MAAAGREQPSAGSPHQPFQAERLMRTLHHSANYILRGEERFTRGEGLEELQTACKASLFFFQAQAAGEATKVNHR